MFKTRTIGHSEFGLPISVLQKSSAPTVLIMSGLHGDEVEGMMLNSMLMSELRDSPLADVFAFLPIANPDGFSLYQRWNSHKIDLNRNWPTEEWTSEILNPRYPPGPSAASEAETRAMVDYMLAAKFKMVIELHSFKDSVLLPHFRGVHATALEAGLGELQRSLQIPIAREEVGLGYKITGGLHTWCEENQIQNFALEIEKGSGQFAVKERYLAAFLRFLEGVAAIYPVAR